MFRVSTIWTIPLGKADIDAEIKHRHQTASYPFAIGSLQDRVFDESGIGTTRNIGTKQWFCLLSGVAWSLECL